jgi:hypothetical protein
MRRTLFLASTFAVIFGATAHGDGLVICNNTKADARAAIAWVNPNFGSYQTKGWFNITACGCEAVWSGTPPQDGDRPENAGLFLYAQSSAGSWGKGPRWCVDDTSRFEMYATEVCSTKKPFTFLSFPRHGTHTEYLNGNPTGCPVRQRIDQ